MMSHLISYSAMIDKNMNLEGYKEDKFCIICGEDEKIDLVTSAFTTSCGLIMSILDDT